MSGEFINKQNIHSLNFSPYQNRGLSANELPIVSNNSSTIGGAKKNKSKSKGKNKMNKSLYLKLVKLSNLNINMQQKQPFNYKCITKKHNKKRNKTYNKSKKSIKRNKKTSFRKKTYKRRINTRRLRGGQHNVPYTPSHGFSENTKLYAHESALANNHLTARMSNCSA
jgi:hypothetical protein